MFTSLPYSACYGEYALFHYYGCYLRPVKEPRRLPADRRPAWGSSGEHRHRLPPPRKGVPYLSPDRRDSVECLIGSGLPLDGCKHITDSGRKTCVCVCGTWKKKQFSMQQTRMHTPCTRPTHPGLGRVAPGAR